MFADIKPTEGFALPAQRVEEPMEAISIINEEPIDLNYEEIIRWYELPFYKRWFIKKPTKEFIELLKQANEIILFNK